MLENDTYTVHLPLIVKSEDKYPILGTCVQEKIENAVPYLIPNSLIHLDVDWNVCEPIRGEYSFDRLIERMTYLRNYNVTITVKNSPEWARSYLYPDIPACSPRPEFYQDYAELCIKAAQICNTNRIHIWNEPDAPGYEHYFGGFYNGKYPYFGGDVYGDFLRYVIDYLDDYWVGYEIIGGALTGDPYSAEKQGFLNGLLLSGVLPHYLSFHCYRIGDDFDYLDAMVNYLKSTMFSHGVSLPLWMSEFSVLADTPSELQEQYQAEFAEYVIANAERLDIKFAEWYSLFGSGWMNADLVDRITKRKKPAWYIVNEYING